MKTTLKIFICSIFYGYANHMVKIGDFKRANIHIQKAYKWSPNGFNDLCTLMLEGILRHKEENHSEAENIYLSVTKLLQAGNAPDQFFNIKEELAEYEEIFGTIPNKKFKHYI